MNLGPIKPDSQLADRLSRNDRGKECGGPLKLRADIAGTAPRHGDQDIFWKMEPRACVGAFEDGDCLAGLVRAEETNNIKLLETKVQKFQSFLGAKLLCGSADDDGNQSSLCSFFCS